MQKNGQGNGAEEVSVTLTNGGALIEAQRAATENATQIAKAAWHNALSVNKAWMELWGSRLEEYLKLPKRFVDAQTHFVEQAVNHYQESMQKLGGLATKATHDAQAAVKETQSAQDRVARQFQGDGQAGHGQHREVNRPSGNQEYRDAAHQPGGR